MRKYIVQVYVSRANVAFKNNIKSLKDLAHKAAQKNKDAGVTGILVFYGNYFLQVLEGPEDIVDALLNVIAKDPRHCELKVVHREPITDRIFGDWNMEYFDIEKYFDIDTLSMRQKFQQVMHGDTTEMEAVMEAIRSFPSIMEESNIA